MSVTFGASTWLWTSPFTSDHGDLLRGIARLGFDAVELPIEDPDLVDPAKIRPILEETGLTPYLCGAFGPGRDLTNADAAVRASEQIMRKQVSAGAGDRLVEQGLGEMRGKLN